MRGFLSLEPTPAAQQELAAIQNRLHDALSRQGVHFADRFGAPLLNWPFGTLEELDQAAEFLQDVSRLHFYLGTLQGRPNHDRPAEVGFEVLGLQAFQESLFARLKPILDPDPIKPPFIRLVRISPPSRKVGAALHGSGLIGTKAPSFVAASLTLWRQSPQGYEAYRTMALVDGGS